MSKPSSPPLQPWDRQPKEPPIAYRHFLTYRDAGPERTLSGVYRRVTGRISADQPSGCWTEWNAKYRWVERAQAWDDHLRRQQEAAQVQAIQDAAKKWAERWTEQLEADFRNAKLFESKAVALGKMPVTKTVKSADGKTTVHPLPAVDLRRAMTVLEKASTLARGAIQAATPEEDRAAPPPSRITPEEAEAMIAAQLRVRAKRDGFELPDIPEE